MLDFVALVTFLVLFPSCVLYVTGCNRLKGKR